MERKTDNPAASYPAMLTRQGREDFLTAWARLAGRGRKEERTDREGHPEERTELPFKGVRTKEQYCLMYDMMEGAGQAAGRGGRMGQTAGDMCPLYTESRIAYYDTPTDSLYLAAVSLTDGAPVLTLSRTCLDRKIGVTAGKGESEGCGPLIVFLQEGRREDRIFRFRSLDGLREAARPHGIEIGRDVRIGRYTILGDGCQLEDGVRLGDECVIGERCRVGKDTHIGDGAFLDRDTRIGARCAVGRDGEVGRGGRIGDDTVIGDHATLNERVTVGAGSAVAPWASVGRDSRIGRGCVLGGHAVTGFRCAIEDGATLPPSARLRTGSVWDGRLTRDIRSHLRR